MNRRPSRSRESIDSFSPHNLENFRLREHRHTSFLIKKPSSAFKPFFYVLVLILVLTGINTLSNLFVRVQEITVPVIGLTEAFDGFTILHITDLKGHSFGRDQKTLRMALDKKKFDLVALTGDMISPQGNAEPFYALLDMLKEIAPGVPVVFIAGDEDPEPLSLTYASSGTPQAPWIIGAQMRGALHLTSPLVFSEEEQQLFVSPLTLNTLDLSTLQEPYERAYVDALSSGDEIRTELAEMNLNTLEEIRTARRKMRQEDAYLALTHVPPDLTRITGRLTDLPGNTSLILCGNHLGGLFRLPLIGPVYLPAGSSSQGSFFPGDRTFTGSERIGSTTVCYSSGLGFVDRHYPKWLFRFCNPPSVNLISLTPSKM